MSMFQKAAPVNRRPEATEEFRRAIDVAIATAQHFHVDGRVLGDISINAAKCC